MNPFMIVGIVILVLILLYLLAIKPRGLHKPDWTPFKGYDFAHRGLHNNESEAPENSMAAFCSDEHLAIFEIGRAHV